MHQSLRGFVAERVNRQESVPESLNAGFEEALDLVIQIEKPDVQKLPIFLPIVVVPTQPTPVKNMRICITLSMVFFFSSGLKIVPLFRYEEKSISPVVPPSKAIKYT